MNVAEFAERCGLSAHTLRYYERIGLLGVARQMALYAGFPAALNAAFTAKQVFAERGLLPLA